MIEIDRKHEVVMYIRGNKNQPLGYIYFKYSKISDSNVISIGWSKVNSKHDTFNKERGQNIAIKRGYKSNNWVVNSSNVNDSIASAEVLQFGNIPFILKDNIYTYFNKAKYHFRLKGPVIFVMPIIERSFIFSGNEMMSDGKIETKTRYIKVMY